MFGRVSLLAKMPLEDELVPWTDLLDGDSRGTVAAFCTGRDRADEVSEAALARSKDLGAVAAKVPSAAEGARSPLAAYTGPLARCSASRHRPVRLPALSVVAHHARHREPDARHLEKKYGVPSQPILRSDTEGKENVEARGRAPLKRLPRTLGRPPTPQANGDRRRP